VGGQVLPGAPTSDPVSNGPLLSSADPDSWEIDLRARSPRVAENLDDRRGGRRCLCGACEPVSQHGAEGHHENGGLASIGRPLHNDGRKSIMDIIQSRCAGMDVSSHAYLVTEGRAASSAMSGPSVPG
jgi:hypothetical protein